MRQCKLLGFRVRVEGSGLRAEGLGYKQGKYGYNLCQGTWNPISPINLAVGLQAWGLVCGRFTKTGDP